MGILHFARNQSSAGLQSAERDTTVTIAETLNIFASEALAEHNLGWLPLTTIAGAVLYSAWQNTYVNWIHVRWSWVTDPRDAK